MFWGLTLESQKRYTQTVTETFHISQAAIDHTTVKDNDPTQVLLDFDDNTYVIATLSKHAKIYQVALDLNFQQGDHIAFRTSGTGRVHLTGYHVTEDGDLESRLMAHQDEDTDDELEEEEEEEETEEDDSLVMPGKRRIKAAGVIKSKKMKELSDDELGDSTLAELDDLDSEDSEGFEEEDSDEDNSDDDEEDENDQQAKKVRQNGSSTPGKKGKEASKTPVSEKKVRASNVADDSSVHTPKAAKTPKLETPKSKKKQENKGKQEVSSPKSEKKAANGEAQSPQKKVLEGGVIAEEIKNGEGAVAKNGKMVTVYYVGRLKSNNKQFDATTGGQGFKFRLGRGEVIRGWDIGVQGMRVGSKRRLTIPAALAYGAKGSPPAIPANATLIFDVELRAVS